MESVYLLFWNLCVSQCWSRSSSTDLSGISVSEHVHDTSGPLIWLRWTSDNSHEQRVWYNKHHDSYSSLSRWASTWWKEICDICEWNDKSSFRLIEYLFSPLHRPGRRREEINCCWFIVCWVYMASLSSLYVWLNTDKAMKVIHHITVDIF
jgi:hypothetical protein